MTSKQKYVVITTELLLLPQASELFSISDRRLIDALKTSAEADSQLIVVFGREGKDAPEGAVGVKATLEQIFVSAPNDAKLCIKTDKRVKLKNLERGENGMQYAEATPIKFYTADETVAEKYFAKAKELYDEFVNATGRRRIELEFKSVNTDIDKIVATLQLPIEAKAAFIVAMDTEARLLMFINALSKLIAEIDVDAVVADKVKDAMDDNQKEYYIREQIKALSEELGDEDDTEEYYTKIDNLKAPDFIKEKLKKETRKIKRTAPASPEMAILKNYLDVAIDLPWGIYTEDNEDLNCAKRVLDEDHYGLKDVKERLIEALAVRKLSKDGRSPIICLVGAPGIGKTSIAKSIARAMNKKYVRLSFGGVRDEAEIRGHRKTYVGAMPGRIITSIQTAGSMNPVFLMDEIDKMASDYKGDPASALLEVLDPEQNVNFRDHFLELPFDLSKVLFITTANSLETISKPLLDRMEIIEMSGYTDEEKLQIAKRHLIPKAHKQNGIEDGWVSIDDGAILKTISGYTSESGVRGLEKQINKIMRKVATVFVDNRNAPAITVTKDNLLKYLGEPKYLDTQIAKEDEVGVVTGLAWTSVGGTTLPIEVIFTKGKGDIVLTGNLGDVMKESARIAVTYCRSNAAELGVDEDFFKTHDIHVHAPEGAVPKDGPSAGVTIATAIVSAMTGKKVDHNVAMTGELTLRGKVLPIGGLKEKTLAAVRAGITKVFVPEENRKDYKELPDVVKDKLNFTFVGNVKNVINGALL